MKNILILLISIILTSEVIARDLTKPPLVIENVEISKEAMAKEIASKAYIQKMNMGILSTESVSGISIIKMGYEVKGFAKIGDLIWETKVLTIEGAYRATIWVNPVDGSVLFVNGPWGEDERPVITATPVLDKKSRLSKSNIDPVTIAEIKKSLQSGVKLIKPTTEFDSVITIQEAFDFISVNLSMAYIPEFYFEDKENFYFSGGTMSAKITDFSSGIALNKQNGSVTSWKLRE